MNNSTDRKRCVGCTLLFADDDDVVYCPVCGAPHHRECYMSAGHCAQEELHGTDKQYDLLKKAAEEEYENKHNRSSDNDIKGQTTCQFCNEEYDYSLNQCPKCGAPNIAKSGGSFVNFDFLGGIPADCDIGEGVTAEEAKRFVALNTQRYIPKFASLSSQNKISWNWLAFFFPGEWMFSRKMFSGGFIAGAITVLSNLFCLPLNQIFYNNGLTQAENYSEIFNEVNALLPKINPAVIFLTFFGLFLNLALRLFVALTGDYFYKKYTVSSIKTIRAESQDMDYDYRRKGGANIIFFLLAFLAIQYIPEIITFFIK